ncbi:MAG TPA: VWA domain-containing protein [Roseiflexaceae bacterium]|nr:VWA domain-containing protein [Roseiflexaceae bacterium]HMP39802.1 VWA domain-containing protein [Roseiflexaceae bacterium]
MSFLLPLGLLALLALPLIFLLHMLRERRRRVLVPSLLLWQRVPQRRVSERRFQLPRSLLLLLHLLIAALIGLALARPQLAGALPGGAVHLAIVVDHSTSMTAASGGTTRLNEARRRAADLISSLGAADRVTLIAAGPTAQIVASGSAADSASLLAALDQVAPGGSGLDLTAGLALAEAALDPLYSRRIVVISDGGVTSAPGQVGVPLEWLTVGRAQPNRALVRFAARPWGNQIQIYARVANTDIVPYAAALRLYGDEMLLNSENVGIAANSETELTWRIPAEYQTLRIEIDGNDGLPDDDHAFLNVVRARSIRTLLVSDRPDIMRRALQAVPGVQLTVVGSAGYGTAAAADLTVFDAFLPDAWPDGAVLAVNPPAGNPLVAVVRTNEELGDKPLRQQGVAAGLSLSGVQFGPLMQIEPPAWATVELAAADLPLIMRGRNDGRDIAVWAFAPAEGSLSTRLAFPILVGRTVRDLTPSSLPAAVAAGVPFVIRPDPRAESLRISGPDGAERVLPAESTVAIDTPTQPGFYLIEEQIGGTMQPVGWIGVNAGSALEADLTPQPAPQITAPTQDVGQAVQYRVSDLWPWLAVAALLFLALEWGYVLR